ncbi:MAG: hypothetical protein KBC50_02365 [Candidatus Pacebacteria bacterium]|jgi:hypothetical protein|nr:hypothetical protein [Candidatus Paceibacterota bacterium]
MKNILHVALWVSAVTLSLFVVQVAIGTGVDGQGWNWTLADFVFAFVLMFGTGVAYTLLVKKTDRPARRYSIGVILAVIFALIWIQVAVGIFDKQEYKLVVRDKYTFEVPVEWTVADARDVDGCSWDAVVNDGADGHRQNGEVGIYEKSCFNIELSRGKQEVTEKDGYYIIAYYDEETNTTTPEEVAETKRVHKKISETFSVK